MNPPPQNSPPYPRAGDGSGLAIASLVLGILGIVLCLGPLTGIPAVVCGHLALSKIKRTGAQNNGMVIAGLITGYISIAMIVVIGALAAVAIPSFFKARHQAAYQHCQSNLRMIQQAKETWALENRKTAEAEPSRADLTDNQLLREPFHCPSGGIYHFNTVKENPTCTIHGKIGSGVTSRRRSRSANEHQH